MVEEALFLDPALARFYDLQNPWRADFDYCANAAKGCARILDLGCGTGMLTAKLAETAEYVVGLDPAAAMLEIAANRPGGDRVRWIEGDMRQMDLQETFDLIILTGHAFQTLITDADQANAFSCFKAHLAQGGTLIFDSRNPSYRAWEGWSARDVVSFDDPDWGTVEQRSTFAMENEVVTYEDTYRVLATGAEHHSRCRIRFRSKAGIDGALRAAGLAAAPCYGDWHGAELTETSPELLYHVGHL